MTTWRSLVCAAGVTFAVTTAALGQDAAEDAEGPIESGDLIGGDITVYGTRTERQVLDVPANITVIPGDTIEKQNITDMQELIRYQPGIDVNRQTSGTDPFNTFSGFTIRGVGGNRVQMVIDGARVPERIIDGTRDFIDLDFVKQVDIVRGPGSVLFGSDALGGIVAIETIDPEDLLKNGKSFGGFLSIDYDSFDNGVDTSIAGALKLSDSLSVLVGLSGDRANEGTLNQARADGGLFGCPRNIASGATPCNKLDPTDFLSGRGLAKIVFEPNDEHRFELTADVMRRTTRVDFNQVLGPVVSNFTGLPTGVVINDYDRRLTVRRKRFALEHDWDADLDWLDRLKWSVSYAPQSTQRRGNEFSTNAMGESVLDQDSLDYSEDFFEFDIQATTSFQIAGIKNVLTYGFDGDYTKTTYERIDRVTNFTTGTFTERRAGGFNFADAKTIRADFFLQDEISFFDGRVELIPGVRVAHYSIDPDPNPDYQPVVGQEPRKISETAVTAKVGAILHLDDYFAAYAQFGQGFKMPTAQQLFTSLPGTFFNLVPAPNLQPETVNNFELGFRGEFDDGFFSVNGFYADYDDFIQAFFNPPGTNDFTYRNLTDVKVWGIEASGEYEFYPNVTANASLSWQRGIQVAAPGAETTAFNVAPLTVVAGLDYVIPSFGLEFSVVGTFATAADRTDDPALFMPGGYAVFDAYGTWEVLDGVTLNAAVLNIANARYFEAPFPNAFTLPASTSVARTNPLELQTAPGRTFRVGVNVEF